MPTFLINPGLIQSNVWNKELILEALCVITDSMGNYAVEFFNYEDGPQANKFTFLMCKKP